MFDNLSVRNKFLAVAAVPANVLVVLAVWAGAVAQEPLMAVAAGLGAALTLVVAHRSGSTVTARIGSVVDKMSDADADADAEAAEADGADEIGDLDRALAGLRRQIKDEQAAIWSTSRERLGTVVRHFSERNKELLDRQLDHIDWLEATEEDPDRLEHLFELDHLANRMRRNGESIMVAAGADAARPTSGAAPVTDVLRVAMGHNTKYRDIVLRSVDEVLIHADSAWEMTHLLSELLENATQCSPDETPVEVFATHLHDGSYRVIIIDNGCGMDDEQLAAANAVMTATPDLDLTAANSIGLRVAARLAKKLDAAVELSETAGSGVTVEILFPAGVVAGPVEQRPGSATQLKPSTPAVSKQTEPSGIGEWVAPTVEGSAEVLAARATAEPVARRAATQPVAASATPTKAASRTLGEALGTDGDFDADVQHLLHAEDAEDEASWEPTAVAAKAAADELGLTRRKRSGAGRAPGGPARPVVRVSTRKPDEVRSRINEYRDGLKGKRPSGDAGQG